MRIGFVVIGRNEGERLKRCFESLAPFRLPTVYVDSGSKDNSASTARSLGIEVVELEEQSGFTAARARNEGPHRLLKLHSDLEAIQFVDGDCEIVAGWLAAASEILLNHADVGSVCGGLTEREANQTIYNELCSIEWDVPVGEVKASGGNALTRSSVLKAVGDYCPTLIAAEDDELCFRIRKAGWKILHLSHPMAIHDAGIIRFSQWWKRAKRAGYAFAQGAHLTQNEPLGLWRRELRSNYFWGAGVPITVIMTFFLLGKVALLLLAGYLSLGVRIYLREKARLKPQRARLYAVFCVAAKFPGVLGQFQYYLDRLFKKRPQLIEYK